MNQVQVTVPAVVTAPKASRKARQVATGTMQSAGIATTPAVVATAPKIEVCPIKFKMLQNYRPTGGGALYAHTSAVLTLLGMDQGKAVPRATLLEILGPTALKHHTETTWFFMATSKGIELSEMGKANHHWINANPVLKEAFTEILTTGKTSKDLPVSYTNPTGIKPLGYKGA